MKKLSNEELKKVNGGGKKLDCAVFNLALLSGKLSFQDQMYWAKKCK
ncbi:MULTISPECIES: bacteriocin [Aerococcus]|uniref:Bacteriocin n=1 Tax=Aerococcus sanguinicola TaxID=119206 RepID=A0A5N1GJP3_9LACT|nr:MULTISPECIES: bacteriocin [Aerococcus]KAA9301205.1 bacteriocin [Aerococcus sanguinicola]MDK6369262.1 bacteriocin [Aerococcus sp. UMB9870]MDK6679086.1 bacteriocin [Aerococcus sp. UMB8608]MDK6686993.1 bacteriocin [Aerococcus sp. UMB8623]MDK6940149.1 bacteriocin [Aerococcus sp. UMB8487]